MKPIELTEKQKEQLLEMCKKLFPEYKHFGFVNDFSDEGIMEYHNNDWNKMKLVHWFEFTTKRLAPNLFVKKYNPKENDFEFYVTDDMTTFAENCIVYDKHPIDYLYNEFTKIFKE